MLKSSLHFFLLPILPKQKDLCEIKPQARFNLPECVKICLVLFRQLAARPLYLLTTKKHYDQPF